MASTMQEIDDTYMEDSFVMDNSKGKKSGVQPVVVDSQHPFDLDAYISSYDRTRVQYIN